MPPLKTLDDVVAQGQEVVSKGFTALKANVFLLDENPRLHLPGFARRDYKPFFDHQAMDVAIIDKPWNDVAESIKIANMADTYEVNVAPHNFYGYLATMMSAHFSAVIPNLRIMEYDPDMVPWQGDLVTVKPHIENGYMYLPTGPGWGTEINEEAVKAHPPRKRTGV